MVMFQSRRDPGRALRRWTRPRKVKLPKSFNPVVIRAGRCANAAQEAIQDTMDAQFQSRRDPGRALRLGDCEMTISSKSLVSIPS